MRRSFWLSLLPPLAVFAAILPAQTTLQTSNPSTVDASAMRSSPNAQDGIDRAFRSLTSPGTVTVPPGYPFDAERFFRPTLPGGHLLDLRGGGQGHTFSDTQPAGRFQGAFSFGLTCGNYTLPLFTQASGQQFPLAADCQLLHQIVTVPGMSLGNGPLSGNGRPAPSGWLTTKGLDMVVDSSAAGITGGVDMFLNKFGIGDVHNYWYVQGEGGFRAASDEMLQGRALHAGEMAGPTYTGTVTASSAFKLATTPVTGGGTQGVGRMLIDTSAPLASGCVTNRSQLKDASGQLLPVTLYDLGCGAVPLPVSTAWGTLDTDADNVPYIPSTGSNTVVAPTTIAIRLTRGAFEPGDLAVFAGDYHETATVLSAQPAAQGLQTVTFALAHTHSAHTAVMQSPFGAGGLDLLANDVPGLRYVLDVLGATSPTQIAVVQFAGAQSYVVADSNMMLGQFPTLAALTNTGGSVTLPLLPQNIEQQTVLQNYPLITISNAANPAFNGPCLNLHRTGNGFPAYAQCTQASSTGQTSPGTSAVVSLGDTGYGNSRFILFPLAQVLDVQDYSTYPPQLNGAFRLEPNALPLRPGDTVEEPHDYAAGYVASAVGFGFENIFASQFSSIEDPGVGGHGINGAIYARYTKYVNPCAYYTGCGGLLSPPHGYQVGGVATGLGGMERAPWPSGSPFTYAGCDPRTNDCSDPFYHYSVFFGQGFQGRNLNLDWNPNNGYYTILAPHVAIPQAPLATGAMLFVCADPQTKEIVYKAKACDQP